VKPCSVRATMAFLRIAVIVMCPPLVAAVGPQDHGPRRIPVW
jgi:hypothetical protein